MSVFSKPVLVFNAFSCDGTAVVRVFNLYKFRHIVSKFQDLRRYASAGHDKLNLSLALMDQIQKLPFAKNLKNESIKYFIAYQQIGSFFKGCACVSQSLSSVIEMLGLRSRRQDKRMFTGAPIMDVGYQGKYGCFTGLPGFHELDEVDAQSLSRCPYGQAYRPCRLPDSLSIISVNQTKTPIPEISGPQPGIVETWILSELAFYFRKAFYPLPLFYFP
jgi:hypothetical protein